MRRDFYRKVLGVSSVLMLCWGVAGAATSVELSPTSKISEVTVYPGAARVTRTAKVDLAVGANSIKLTDIIPEIDENTLTVSGQGTAAVKIHGGYIKREYLTQEADQKVQDLMTKIETLDDQLVVENNNLQILQRQKAFLDSVNLFSGEQIPKDLVTVMPSADKLGETMKFLADQVMDIGKRGEEIRIKTRTLQREREKVNRELASLRSTGNKMQRSIVVDMECIRPGTLTLSVSYVVNGANWRPLYDARADYNKSEVELTSYGVVNQTTGEDWSDVQLTLSTAKPTIGGRMPYVSPWILKEYQPVPMSRQRNMLMKSTVAGAAMDQAAAPAMQMEAFSNADLKEEKEAPAEVAYSQVSQTGISVIYKIASAATIKSDGTENKFPIATQMLAASYEYSTYPRVTTFAYLGSRVTNAKDLQLLAGQVNLFLDGEFVGKSSIDNIGPAEQFDLYLGVDENVKVTREQIAKKMDDVLLAGIPSPNRRTTFTYKITVENHKPKKIKALIFDAMPVSENERVKVKVYDVTVPPTQKDWKDRKGVWLWELSLEPNAKQEITYSFSVEHPRDMRVDGI